MRAWGSGRGALHCAVLAPKQAGRGTVLCVPGARGEGRCAVLCWRQSKPEGAQCCACPGLGKGGAVLCSQPSKLAPHRGECALRPLGSTHPAAPIHRTMRGRISPQRVARCQRHARRSTSFSTKCGRTSSCAATRLWLHQTAHTSSEQSGVLGPPAAHPSPRLHSHLPLQRGLDLTPTWLRLLTSHFLPHPCRHEKLPPLPATAGRPHQTRRPLPHPRPHPPCRRRCHLRWSRPQRGSGTACTWPCMQVAAFVAKKSQAASDASVAVGSLYHSRSRHPLPVGIGNRSRGGRPSHAHKQACVRWYLCIHL